MDLGPSKENIFHNFRTFFDLVICTSKDVKKTVYLEIRNYLLIIKFFTKLIHSHSHSHIKHILFHFTFIILKSLLFYRINN